MHVAKRSPPGKNFFIQTKLSNLIVFITIIVPLSVRAMNGLWPILSKYAQEQQTLARPTSGMRCQPNQALRSTVGMRQAWRQPQEAKTMAILDGYGRLAQAESE